MGKQLDDTTSGNRNKFLHINCQKMALKPSSLANICPFKLNETYHTLYELQQKLGFTDEYLLSTVRDPNQDALQLENLRKLLDESKITRDNLITWHLKQTLVQLNVTISLLTAKIKFIEYKLGLCEGLDLHQACSLSLVNFCNILADMTILNVKPEDRKTMHKVSKEVDVPIWLSHYRNQICHVPSESPCISILVPLVVKSLTYMKDSFWSKILEREIFDAQGCKKLIVRISSYTTITSINEQKTPKRGVGLGKKRLKLAQIDAIRSLKSCARLRRLLMQNPSQVVDIILNFVTQYSIKDSSRNCALIVEQVILAKCFDKFVSGLLAMSEERSNDKIVLSWLQRIIGLISFRKKENIQKELKKMKLHVSIKMIKLIDIPPIKCSHIAYRLIKLDHIIVKKLIVRLRHKLLPILGKKRTLLLIELTNIANKK